MFAQFATHRVEPYHTQVPRRMRAEDFLEAVLQLAPARAHRTAYVEHGQWNAGLRDHELAHAVDDATPRGWIEPNGSAGRFKRVDEFDQNSVAQR